MTLEERPWRCEADNSMNKLISKTDPHSWYNHYNRVLFGNRLQQANGKLGAWVVVGYRRDMDDCWGRTTAWKNLNGTFRIQIAYDLRRCPWAFKQALIHEMIHADVFVRKIHRYFAHGQAFQKEARRIFRHPEYLKLFGVYH